MRHLRYWRWPVGIFLLLLVAFAGLYAYNLRNGRDTLPAQYYVERHTGGDVLPKLDHVVLIVEENKPQEDILGNAHALYINKLLQAYAWASRYYAVTNPSLPNYIALTSGTTAGISNDCNPPSSACRADVRNLGDLIESSGRSWKMYAESMPEPCYRYNAGDYVVRHNPFLYYPDILGNTKRCDAHVVPFTQFNLDIARKDSLPDYAFITPNLCHDMHDCSVAAGDAWLAQEVPIILKSLAFTNQHSLLAIVWDEGDNSDNNVMAIFAGPAAKQHYTSTTYYSHYSLLHTIEQAWHLEPLTAYDRAAPVMTDMLR